MMAGGHLPEHGEWVLAEGDDDDLSLGPVLLNPVPDLADQELMSQVNSIEDTDGGVRTAEGFGS